VFPIRIFQEPMQVLQGLVLLIGLSLCGCEQHRDEQSWVSLYAYTHLHVAGVDK
jgi:hypothetical protein